MVIPGHRFAINLVQRRTLLFQLVRRDFEQRFVGSAAGWLWGLIHPVVLLVSWVFVFQVCLKTQLPHNEVTQNYSLFLFCGFLPWLLFSETVTRSAVSLLDNSNLITKTVFPAEIVPVSLPLYMLLIGLFAVGVSWIVSGLQVYLRDTAQVLSVVLTFWFWVTPIFIDEQAFPQWARFALRLNPLAFVVRAYRDRLLSYRVPNFEDLAIVTAYAVTAFLVGGLFFRHLKRGFADVL
jgi:lipopolysaccharide transport system permease protein